MATNSTQPKLVVITGPTASGKSQLAMQIAQWFNGEIIAADSRTIYKGLDIGTAKPSKADQRKVPHWGIDLIEPGQQFTAADFKVYAEQKITEIRGRGKLPILVGGTGLYIDSVVFDFKFGPQASSLQREKLESLSVEKLQQMILDQDLKMPQNNLNKRHLIRTIELDGLQPSKRSKPVPGTLIVGIMPPDEVLKKQMKRRARAMFKTGVAKEAKKLKEKYPDFPAESAGLVYKLCSEDSNQEEQKILEAYLAAEWQYVRRQRTWFRRNPFIHWFTDAQEAEQLIKEVLNT